MTTWIGHKAGLYKNNDKEGKSHLSRAKSLQKKHFKGKNINFSGKLIQMKVR